MLIKEHKIYSYLQVSQCLPSYPIGQLHVLLEADDCTPPLRQVLLFLFPKSLASHFSPVYPGAHEHKNPVLPTGIHVALLRHGFISQGSKHSLHCLIPRWLRFDRNKFISLPSTDTLEMQPKKPVLTPILLMSTAAKLSTPPMNRSNPRFSPTKQHGEYPLTAGSSSNFMIASSSCLRIMTVCQIPNEKVLALRRSPGPLPMSNRNSTCPSLMASEMKSPR